MFPASGRALVLKAAPSACTNSTSIHHIALPRPATHTPPAQMDKFVSQYSATPLLGRSLALKEDEDYSQYASSSKSNGIPQFELPNVSNVSGRAAV